jgi:conjugal transfer pilus assembly protein TraK
MKKLGLALIALMVGTSVMAQAGSRPPASPVSSSTEVPMDDAPPAQGQARVQARAEASAGPSVPGLDGPQRTIVRDVPGERAARTDAPSSAELEGAGFAGQVAAVVPVVRPRPTARRPAAEIEVEVGVNRTFAVAKAHINRIVTPFTEAKVVTTSAAGIKAEGGIIYVSTNTDESIGLFIHEASDPENAISLTLVPDEIDQVSTKVSVRGMRATERRATVAPTRDVAQTFETASPYVETLTALMADLAHGRMPEGYGLEQADVTRSDLPNCRIPGARTVPAQVITGSELFVVVYRLTAGAAMTVDESKCSEAARAVAAWPKRSLRAGEETEVYAVFTVPSAEEVESIRPSVIGGSR